MDGVRSSVLVIQKLFILIVDLQWITPRYCFNETSCRPRLIGEKKKCSKSLHLKVILEKQDGKVPIHQDGKVPIQPIHQLVKYWTRLFSCIALIKKKNTLKKAVLETLPKTVNKYIDIHKIFELGIQTFKFPCFDAHCHIKKKQVMRCIESFISS